MKKTIKIAALALLFSVAALSCKKNVSDAELTTQSTTVVAAYPGTSVEVKEGVAHLSGTFASQEEKDAALKKASDFYNSGNVDSNSIAAKANMVKKFNEKNNK